MAMAMGVCPKAGVSACRADEYCIWRPGAGWRKEKKELKTH